MCECTFSMNTFTVSAVLLMIHAANETFIGCSSFLFIISTRAAEKFDCDLYK